MGCGASKKQNKAASYLEQLKEQFKKCDQELVKKQEQITILQKENKIHQIRIAEKEKILIMKRKFDLEKMISKLQDQIFKTQSAYEKGQQAEVEQEEKKKELENMKKIVEIYENNPGNDKIIELQAKIQEHEDEDQLNKMDGNQIEDAEFLEYVKEHQQQLQTQVNGNPIKNSDVQTKELLQYPNLDQQFQPIDTDQQQNNLQKYSHHSELIQQ